jgi:hypothetical protein
MEKSVFLLTIFVIQLLRINHHLNEWKSIYRWFSWYCWLSLIEIVMPSLCLEHPKKIAVR